jgi:predicted transcriptional regulator
VTSKQTESNVRVQAVVSREMAERLKHVAELEDRSISSFLRGAVRDRLREADAEERK